MTWRPSSLAVIVLPSGEKKASSALNGVGRAKLPATGNVQTIAPAGSRTMSRPLPRSAMSTPFGKGLPTVGPAPLADGIGVGLADEVGPNDAAGASTLGPGPPVGELVGPGGE